jgi:hypothetical protein
MGASAAKGAILQGKNTTYQTITNTGDFDFPMPAPVIEDITSHSTSANQEEKFPTILQAPVISVPITAWDDSATMHAWLVTNNGTVQAFKYTGAGHATAFAFNAIIELTFSNAVKGVKKAVLKLTVANGDTPS